ncbi:CHAD domain-containing protein [Streptomyces sp. BK79]|uniref:CHAD domain-containing protein n=1 Tax=Streptomyces sp. BK79 TaxID=3350097 RepID=UPI00376FB744
MAQRHLDPTDPTAPAPAPAAAGPPAPADADALAGYLRAQATEFLRALRLHRETGAGAGGAHPADRARGAERAAAPSAGRAGPARLTARTGDTGGRSGPAGDAPDHAGHAGTSHAGHLSHAGHGGPTGPTGSTGHTGPVDAVRALRRAARRLSGTLHTFQPLLDADWAEGMRPELAWLSGTLALEHAYASRLERLLQALHRLSGPAAFPAQQAGRATATTAVSVSVPAAHPASPDRGSLTVGAAKAGALLDRQLTLARTRAHSTALQALGSSRFHAVADKVALLASEVPLRTTGTSTASPHSAASATSATSATDLSRLAAAAQDRLTDAVAALPLVTAGNPYNAQALVHGLSPDPAPHPQDAQWHQVRLLLRLHRYALEVLGGGSERTTEDVRLLAAGEALDRHRDASEAAAAAAQAARTPRIAPATAYALGVLHADQRHEVEAARYAFQHSWRKDPIRLP